MAVLHISPTFFGDESIVGGGERYALELARAVSRHEETTLLTFGSNAAERRDGALRIVVAPATSGDPSHDEQTRLLNLVSRSAIARYAISARVIHCFQTEVAATDWAITIGRLLGKPVFATPLGGAGTRGRFARAASRFVSEYLHVSAFSALAYPSPSGRSRVVLGGVDVDRFSVPPPTDGRRGVLFVGRLLPHKGVHHLINACPPDEPLSIVGRAYDAQYRDTLHRLASAKRVSFVEDATDDDVARAYASHAITVLPSVYNNEFGASTAVPELLGQTLLEGMAAGAAVVGSSAGGIPEVIGTDGSCGILVPPGDEQALRAALLTLILNPIRTAATGAAGRNRARTVFTWDAVARRCLAAYDGLRDPLSHQ